MISNYYSKNASEEMKEFDERMRKINEEFLSLTPEELDAWDPEDDYIPELDDIKPIKECSNTNKNKYTLGRFDDELEWKENYDLGLTTTIDDDVDL